MFKVGDWVGIKDDSANWIKKVAAIEYKKTYDSKWNEYEIEILVFEDGAKLGSGWAIHATKEEIAAGHRINKSPLMQHLDKCEEVVKTWPKWKLQSVRDALGIPKYTDEVDNSDLEYHVSPLCKIEVK